MAKINPAWVTNIVGPNVQSEGTTLTRQPNLNFSEHFDIATDDTNKRNTVSMNSAISASLEQAVAIANATFLCQTDQHAALPNSRQLFLNNSLTSSSGTFGGVPYLLVGVANDKVAFLSGANFTGPVTFATTVTATNDLYANGTLHVTGTVDCGAGDPAVIGNIGIGMTATAQYGWLKIQIDGGEAWIPYWRTPAS